MEFDLVSVDVFCRPSASPPFPFTIISDGLAKCETHIPFHRHFSRVVNLSALVVDGGLFVP